MIAALVCLQPSRYGVGSQLRLAAAALAAAAGALRTLCCCDKPACSLPWSLRWARADGRSGAHRGEGRERCPPYSSGQLRLPAGMQRATESLRSG